MSTLGRTTLLLMIPVDLLLIAWVWFGRLAFGVGGWFLLILVPVALVLLVALALTTVLAYTQDGRPRALTPLQAWAQLLTWAGMLGFGLFVPDFGDAPESELSALTQVFGRSDRLLDLSYTLATVFAGVTVVAYVVLLVVLVVARRRAPAPAW